MKGLLLFGALFLFSYSSFSQITLGTADFPHSGDIDTMSIATPFSGMDYQSTGAGFTWDFSNLDSTTTGLRIDTFVTVAQAGSIFSLYFSFLNPANHALRSPDVALGPVSLTGIYNFYHNSAANYHQSGFGATIGGLPITLPISSIPLGYVPSDVIYKFPLNYGNVDSCAPVDTLGIPGLLYYKNSKTRHNEVDGWGSITTPYGTFNCLRVKSIIHEHDTIYLDTLGVGFGFDLPERIEYKWLGKGMGEPLLQVVTTGGIVSEVVYRGYPVCAVAAFTTTQDTIMEGMTLNFTNTTNKTNQYQWKIDGTTFATSQDAAYTFNAPGTYTVTLVSTHLSCTDVTSKVITVLYANCNLAASYSTLLDTIFDGTNLSFTNASGPVGQFGTYDWKIGQNSFSTVKNTSYLFTTPGTYLVTLVATDMNCTDSITKKITVFYTNCDLATTFNPSNTTIFKGQNVAFMGWSKAPVTYEWRLNGAFYSNAKDTGYIFNSPGAYPVTLITSYLNCSDTVNRMITVLPPVFNMEIYPNPVVEDVTIFCTLPEQSDMKIEMIDVLGQILIKNEWKDLQAGEHHLFLSIPPSAMASGNYFLRINWKNEEFIKRLAVTRE